jgi:UDP-3-O-[3-hydroxymyristoyl] glucosamine N-acyltransferase
MIVAQAGVAGSVRLGTGVVLAAKVGISDHVSIGDGAIVIGCSCVSKNLSPGAKVMGIPAVDMEQFIRERGMVRQLPRMAEQLRELIKRVEQLETPADD